MNNSHEQHSEQQKSNRPTGALKIALITFASIAIFSGIAIGVAFYGETTKPLWLKEYEQAQSIENVDRKKAIKLYRQSLADAEKADAPLSSQKQITQKLGDNLYANFSSSGAAAKMTQTNSSGH